MYVSERRCNAEAKEVGKILRFLQQLISWPHYPAHPAKVISVGALSRLVF